MGSTVVVMSLEKINRKFGFAGARETGAQDWLARFAELLFVALSLLPQYSVAQTRMVMQDSTDRPSGDFKIFDKPDADSCRAQCADEARCRDFTFVRAPSGGAAGRCWLKNTVRPVLQKSPIRSTLQA